MHHKSINFPGGLSRLTAAALYSATNEGEIVIINIQIYCIGLSRGPGGGVCARVCVCVRTPAHPTARHLIYFPSVGALSLIGLF